LKLLLLFSHELTDEQEVNAKETFGINNFIYMPDNIKKIWANIPPELENIRDYIQPVLDWVEETKADGDYILIHGDPGATFIAVNEAHRLGLIPIYATTKRVSIEEKDNDGNIRIMKIFKHVRYRKYEV